MFNFLKRKNMKKNKERVKFIKSISPSSPTDISPITNEMKEGNIVILNLNKFLKGNNGRYNVELEHFVRELTYFSKLNNGEIAQLGRNYLILTPGPEIQFFKN
ncbi:MAG: cell division protein SepF [Candidatus Helarchaeota archaeon]